MEVSGANYNDIKFKKLMSQNWYSQRPFKNTGLVTEFLLSHSDKATA